MPHLLPHVADAFFAAVSVVAGIGLLHWLEGEGMLNIKLYEPRMLGSIVIFCGNPAPPSPRSFLVCTACAFVAGIVLHWSMTGATDTGNALAVGFNVLLSKLTNHSFSPAVGLAAFVATKQWQHSLDPVTHLVTPWLSGHCVMYIFALVMSVPRKHLRVRLAMREWLAMEGELVGEGIGAISPAKRGDATTERLKELFMRCDSSGDGRVDATEFRVAYRLLSGDDLPISDCEDIIRAFDFNGNGTIEFSEFIQAVQPYCMNKPLTPTSRIKKN
jgi:hypothetical protein